ncbi:fibronectin type III domain-containing protein [Flavobacterium sp. WG21]|uniref:fibronectin type III domain-containing protein n=1 Tax=Flavobacterium sp. WG21 TaxID=1229487 RepID=UPI000369E24E|nr:fibronectin type III domain-containing protein [Flavobacterium sp. WG21]
MDKIQLPKMLKNLHLYLLLLCSLIGFEGFAQTFPISVTTQIAQPSPIYLSKYADATTINSPIKIQLLLNDLTISNRQVRLKIYFQGNGVSFSNNDFVVGAKPLYLEGGFPLQLTNVDLAPYFQFQNLLGLNPNQYAQPLPEGISNFYVEVYDFATGKKLSRKTGTTTVIFQNEPPFLNLPLNNASIMQQNLQNIVFNWTPRSINVSNVEYEFSLVEIWDNYTPVQNAFAYSPPLYTTTTKMTTLQYGMSEPQLIPGKKYAWRIKAKAILGAEEIGVFKNNGYTEIFAFTYEVFCTSPLAIKTESIGQDQAKINWSGNIDNFDYQVNYREKNSGSEWYKAVTPRENITLSNLKPNTTYEYTVGSSCDVGKYIHSSIYEFTTIARDEIVFQGCGIKPDPKDLTNQTPLPELFPNDVISAGDFPIVVLHATGSNGTFSGDGYVTLPFLEKFRKLIDAAEALSPKDGEGNSKWNLSENTRIKITFDNIGLNTDFKLISGEIVAGYDASNWDKFLDVDKLVDGISKEYDPIMESIFGPKPEKEEEVADASEEEQNTEIINPASPSEAPVEYTPIDIVEVDEPQPTPQQPVNVNTPENNDPKGETKPSNGAVTENGYYIEYKGQKYYNGGKIKIPYRRIMFETFEMKTVPSDAKVTYSIYGPGEQSMLRGYDSSTSKSSLPIEDITLKNNLLIHDLQSEATSIEGNPKVRVEIQKIIGKFTQNALTAKDVSNPKNKNRIAGANQTLYYIDKPPKIIKLSKVDYNDTEIKVTLSNDINLIPDENIKWKINNVDNSYKTGITQFTLPVNASVPNTTFTNISGYPNLTTKEVKVKWIKEGRSEQAFMPPAVSHLVTQFNDDLIKPFKKMTDKLDKFTGSLPGDKQNFKVEVKPIKIKGEGYNEEDDNSRHYFKTLKGSISGGINLKGEFFGYPPFLAFLNIKGISEVGVFISPKVEVNLVGSRLSRTIGETNKKVKDNFVIEGNIKGCIEVGLKAELTVDQDKKDYIEFSVKGSGEGCVSGKRVYNFTTNKWDGGFYIDPVKLAVKAKIKSKGYFKFTLVDYDASWAITDKVDLTKKED